MDDANSDKQVPQLPVLVRETAQQLRRGHEAHGAQNLRQIIELLLSDNTEPNAKLMSALALALAAQQRQDWYGLADSLEYELLDALNEMKRD